MIKLSIRCKWYSTVYVYNIVSPCKWLKGPVHSHRCFGSCTNKDDKGVIGPTLAGAAKLTGEWGNGLHTPTHFWEELLSNKIVKSRVWVCRAFLKKTHSCFEPYMQVCNVQKTPLTVCTLWIVNSNKLYMNYVGFGNIIVYAHDCVHFFNVFFTYFYISLLLVHII